MNRLLQHLLQLWRRLLSLLRRGRYEREMEEEMRFHLEMQIEQNLASGMAAEEARYAARRQFGNQTWLKEASREMWSLNSFETLIQDLRHSARTLLKQPGFTTIAVLALALGIGSNTTIFSVINTVLLQPLPYPGADRLLMAQEYEQGRPPQGFLEHHYNPLLEKNRALELPAAYASAKFTLTGRGQPEELRGKKITGNFLSLLGAQPLLGRAFAVEEYQEGLDQVILISHRLWQRQFGGDAKLIGQTVVLDEQKYTVIGIMPPQFRFEPRDDFWIPLTFSPQELAGRPRRPGSAAWGPGMIGRLKVGVKIAQAEKELSAITQRLESPYPAPKGGYSVRLDSLHELMVKDVRQKLTLFWGAVGFVLLVGCASVANMMLGRAAARQKEIAIRAALGATRSRIARQLLTESILLALAGGAAGLLLSLWGIRLLVAAGTQEIPRLADVGLNAQVLLFTLIVSLVTGLIFGLAPALQYSKADLNHALKEGANISLAGFRLLRRHRVRSALIISEIALATVLLACAGLLIRSFQRLLESPLGYEPERVLTAQLGLPVKKYPGAPQFINFSRRLVERIEALPGVESVGLTSTLPLGIGDHDDELPLAPLPPPSSDGQTGVSTAPRIRTYVNSVSPHYFQTMGIPLKRGREFTVEDNEQAPPVAVISEMMARNFWPDEDPIGQRVQITPSTLAIVVGVVGDVRHTRLENAPRPEVYYSQLQLAKWETWTPSAEFIARAKPTRWFSIVIRAKGRPADLTAAVRDQVLSLDPDQPITNIGPMKDLFDARLSSRRFNMLLFGVFAGSALLLASIGIYGVISYSVAQRVNEIGIRIALGAKQRDVLWLIIGQGMGLALAGLGIGLTASSGLTRLIKSLLYGVSASDPVTLTAVSTLLALTALLACYLPARKATRIDPLAALRRE
jgi:putative ABC transport system permease protein